MSNKKFERRCLQCGVAAMVFRSGHRRTSGLCKRCSALRAARIKSEIYALRRIAVWKPKTRHIISRPRLTPAERVARLDAADPIRIEQKPCRTCGVLMDVIRGRGSLTPGSYRHVCGPCRSLTDRAAKRRSKLKRKALARGASSAQCFDKVEVFERDGWCCQSCGCHAPRHLMGTLDDSAPELDHVIPLARGGEHTRANTQLLCRLCNLLKGAAMPHEWVGHVKVQSERLLDRRHPFARTSAG